VGALLAGLVGSLLFYHRSEQVLHNGFNEKEEAEVGFYISSSKRWFRNFCILACVFGLLVVVVPKTTGAFAIWGVPKIMNNEQLQKLPDNILKVLNSRLDSWLMDIESKYTPSLKEESKEGSLKIKIKEKEKEGSVE
jgi:SpoU rRNA methylase family enzyme